MLCLMQNRLTQKIKVKRRVIFIVHCIYLNKMSCPLPDAADLMLVVVAVNYTSCFYQLSLLDAVNSAVINTISILSKRSSTHFNSLL